MISVAQAQAHLRAIAPDAGTQDMPLSEALGRTLAAPIDARLTQPPLSASAMDGYAVKCRDVGTIGATLSVIGDAPAGTPFDGVVGADQAVRIFTGGAIPTGADTVIIQENVTRNGDSITVTTAQDAPRHIRRAGLDFDKGAHLIDAGTTIDAGALCVIAAANHDTVLVRRPLRVAIVSNGNELREPGSPLAVGQIINANPPALAAMITTMGGVPLILPTARDSVDSITGAITAASDADIILTVGGASVGEHDYMQRAFAEAGLEAVFSKVAVKPGKPTWAGQLGRQAVLGLPGNPASALVCAALFLPCIMGQAAPRTVSAILAAPPQTAHLPANGPRETYLRAVAKIDPQGQMRVQALPRQDSGLMSPFLSANALLQRLPNTEAAHEGEVVKVIMLPSGPSAF